MAVYGQVRHQKNIIWTSEASVHIIYFCDGPVHILPYDHQCHELFAIYYHFIAIYQFPKHIFFLVKIVANASLTKYSM
jgi:hypothetical protein